MQETTNKTTLDAVRKDKPTNSQSNESMSIVFYACKEFTHQSAMFQRIHHVQRDNTTGCRKRQKRERVRERERQSLRPFFINISMEETEGEKMEWCGTERNSECLTNIVNQPVQMHHHYDTGMKSFPKI